MPRKVPTQQDLERGSRLQEERKKIWGSRENFSESTGIASGTLEGWEKKGVDISTKCLAAVIEGGGDVAYILTGRRRDTAPLPDAGAEGGLTSAQREVLEGCIAIEECLHVYQREVLSDPVKAKAVADRFRKLRQALEAFGPEFRISS